MSSSCSSLEKDWCVSVCVCVQVAQTCLHFKYTHKQATVNRKQRQIYSVWLHWERTKGVHLQGTEVRSGFNGCMRYAWPRCSVEGTSLPITTLASVSPGHREESRETRWSLPCPHRICLHDEKHFWTKHTHAIHHIGPWCWSLGLGCCLNSARGMWASHSPVSVFCIFRPQVLFTACGDNKIITENWK